MDNRLTTSRGARRRLLRWMGAVLGMTLLLAGCTPGNAPSSSAPPARTLAVGATLEPPSADPFHNPAASIPQALLYNVYETLVKVDSDGDLEPLLAQTWEVSTDQRTYTFHLNPAAKFASGRAVDGEAVKANYDRLVGDQTVTETLRAQIELVESVEVPASGRVVFTLTRPSVMWLYEMSSTLGMIVDPGFTGDLAAATAGSGPYALKALNKGESVVLSRNEQYWGTPGRFDEVSFRYFTDANAMNAAMLAGDLDIISNLAAPDALPQFADTTRFQVITGGTNGEVVMGLNHAQKKLQDLKVRQAITMAIDRKALLDTVWNGQGALIGSMAVPTDPWYEDLSATNAYDPARAKALLTEAGAEGLTLRLRVPVTPYATKAAQFISSQLRDVGVTVKVEELEFSRWIDEVFTKGDYDLTIVAHVEARDLGKFANPDYYWHYGNPEFATLYESADSSGTDQIAQTMKPAVRFLAEDAAAVWLFMLPSIVITTPGITGVPTNATTLSFDLTSLASR